VDVTSDGLFTLAPETGVALREAPEAPLVWVFYPDNAPVALEMQSLLEAASDLDPRLEFQVVDPGRDPMKALEFNLKEYAVVVQVGENHHAFLQSPLPHQQPPPGLEEQFLAAVVKASADRAIFVGFLKGHGEAAGLSSDPRGLRSVAEALDRRGLTPFSLNILTGGTVGDSLDVIVVAGPETPFSPEELDSLRLFLDRGGSMLVLLDPSSPVTMNELLGPLGVGFDPRILSDPDQLEPQRIHPAELSTHPVVDTLARRRVQVMLPGVGEVRMTRVKGVRQAALMRSGGGTVVAGEDDAEGYSRNLGVALEWESGKASKVSRLVVIGDADFAGNLHAGSLGNTDLFTGAVLWLGQKEERIALSPRARTNRPVILSRQQGRALMVLVVGILPVLVLLSGSLAWWRRR
jgi:ABC-type uncharacterized transport system involved in gliding motility auxiliary subunit